MPIDSIYDFASIEVENLVVDLRRLALDAARHVLAGEARPALTAAQARRLAPLVLPPTFGGFAQQRAERLLRRPLRLTQPPASSALFGPLELVAATAALSRLGRLDALWRKLDRGGVDSGASILRTVARLSFGDPGFREELSMLVAARLARDVVLWPRLDLPVPVEDAALLAFLALVVPRPGPSSWNHRPFGSMRQIEAGLIGDAERRLAGEPASGFGAWLIAEAAELHLARLLAERSRPRWWEKGWKIGLPLRWQSHWRKVWPKRWPTEWELGWPERWRLELFPATDLLLPLVAQAAASALARRERFPLLAAERNEIATHHAPDDDNTPIALRSYLVRHF